MAKDTVRSWDTVASNNTDIAGIGIQGSNAVSNFDGAIRTVMKQIADVDEGVEPMNDTFTLCDPADSTKRVRIDAGPVGAGQTRVLTMPDANVTISSFASTLLDDADADAVKTTLGISGFATSGTSVTGNIVTSGKLSAKGTPVADRGIHVLGNATYGNNEFSYHQMGIYTNANGGNSLEAIIGADHFIPGVYIRSIVRGIGGGILFLEGSDVRTTKLIPLSDNTYTLGDGAARWSVVYSATGSINTSDARDKLWLGGLSAEEGRVADRIRSIIGKFQWLDAVAQKGKDAARIHFGPTAQAVEEAFIAEGLDPTRYGIFCEDPIMEEYFETVEEEKPVTKQQTIKNTEIVIEGGVAVQRVVEHTETVPVMLEFPMVDEKGFPVFDDDGEPLMHSIPATETISRQVPRQRPSGDVRKGLRLSQLALFLLAS